MKLYCDRLRVGAGLTGAERAGRGTQGRGARHARHSARMRAATRPAGGSRHGVGAPRYGHALAAWARPVRAGWAVGAHCALDPIFLTQ